jgi:hypothetical protein
MAHMSNRSILEKADLALSDLVQGGGILKPAQAQAFLEMVTKQSTLLKQVTAVPMKAPKQEIPFIGFRDRILRPRQEGTLLTQAQRSKPSFSVVELDAKAFIGEVHLSDEQLEDNLEGDNLRQTVLRLIAQRVATDMEEIAINGDTQSADPTLATLDGILVQARSHVVDAAGATIDSNLLHDLMRVMPQEYRRNKTEMRFYTGSDAELRYRRSLAERLTNVGDRFLEGNTPITFSGVPLEEVPLFAENTGVTNNLTNILFTHPKNIHLGIWRDVKIEWARDIRQQVLQIVVSLRFDVKFADENGVSKAIRVAA